MLERNLQRQLKKAKLSEDQLPQNNEQWKTFIHAVNTSYAGNKDARYLLEKSLDESSREMRQLNKELKEEAERRIKAIKESEKKSRFMENMSHEIRTPIHGILGSLEIIKDNTNLDSIQQQFVHTALMSGENLLDIVNNILDFSKINAGELKLEAITFDIRELFADINHIIASMAEDKSLKLITAISKDIPKKIKGDPAKVRQIIMNLVSNAIKFTQKGVITSEIKLLNYNDQHTVLRYEITDTGIGISTSKMEDIFKSFTQVDASTTRQCEGIGLGLTISKELTYLMDGTIQLESLQGKGTHFWVDIPFDTVALQDEKTVATDADVLDLKILIVEKEKTSLKVLDYYFSMWGVEYQMVDSSREAVEKLYQSQKQQALFDVVLMDYFMPGMDSLELSEILNTHPDFQRISRVTLSSYHLAKEEREIANIEICLTKPIRETLLKDTLLECIALKTKRSQADYDQMTREKFDFPELAFTNDASLESTDILLAEDNPVNALIAVTMMEQINLSVKHVSNGQEALDEVQNNPYKLVLMDMHMPVMDGYRATEKIRLWEKESKQIKAIPIIALTANALAGDKEKCLSMGMNDYLPKPVKQVLLQDVVTKWMEKQT